MTRLQRFMLVGGGATAICLVGLAGATSVAVLSSGVLATAPGAWATEVHVAGRAIRLNVPGLIRLATAPGVAHLLEGHALESPAGRIAFGRDGKALTLACAPCRLQHAELLPDALTIDRVEIRAERSGALLEGQLVAEGVRIDYIARLAADRIRVDWTLPPTEVARLYRPLSSIVPEARSTRIEGELQARGELDLPAGRGAVAFQVSGLEVGGLGTEVLQFGTFPMSCRTAGGAPRRVVTGDNESRWTPLDRMGPYLPAAVIAAEDQRFHDHAGYDTEEIAALLAESAVERPKRGASTLTQQLARTLFTGGEKTVARKLRELLYAVEMERTLGKARILELYLNTVDWGPGLCGARAAARAYFNKSPAALTPIEAAWLASILRNPHAAHASQFALGAPERERAEWVLKQMREFPRRDRQRWARASLEFSVRKPRGHPA
jgi:hypothetical protein